MMRWLRSKSLMLAMGSALASGFNFYSFVFLPALSGVGNLEIFVRDNYLGGLYLFGIGSSVAPFSVYVFACGKSLALFRYFSLSLAGLVLVGVVGIGIANMPWSYVCLTAAFCMHGAGFFLAGLIRQERILVASSLQVLQPALFAGLLTLHELGPLSGVNWALLYSLSCLICVLSFAASVNWQWLKSLLSEVASDPSGWGSIMARIALSVSFPLFFQLELILCGHFGHTNLGEYSMLQKLYASVSISLFGSVGVLMLSRSVKSGGDAHIGLDRVVIMMALACAACVPLIGGLVVLLGKSKEISMGLILLSTIVAFLYTTSSFLGLKMSAVKPYVGLRFFLCSLLVYGVLFIFMRPDSAFAYLSLAGLFFFVFTGMAVCFGRLIAIGQRL